MQTKRTWRIVVVSPSDVTPERDLLSDVIAELNRGIAGERGLVLELSRWETDSYPGFHAKGPQGLIDPILKIEECDVLIGIFWKRFGTPTMDAQSGTEHEIRTAYDAWKENARPQIMLYFNQKAYLPKSKEEIDQLGRVLEFRQRLPKQGLWWSYNGKSQFEKLTRNHLTQFICRNYPESVPENQPAQTQVVGRSVESLMEAFCTHLTDRVSRVYIVGESESREIEQVFIKLNIMEEYQGIPLQAEFLGLMDSEMRKRRDPFVDFEVEIERKPDRDSRIASDTIKQVIKPEELLRQRAQTVISGAPGCGKTTLLRYLALRALKDGRLPLFLELKTVDEDDFKQARNSLSQLLFDKSVAPSLNLQGSERERLQEYFLARLRAGDAAIFLDGLDEVRGTNFFPTLCSAVSEFVGSDSRNVVVVSTRPYAFQANIQGLQEMEIAPLSRRQVEEFLNHYYGDDSATRSLIQHLRRHRQLREFCSTPFLLSVVAQLHRSGHQIVQDRLELYRQIVLHLAVKLDSAKSLPLSRFHIPDPDGALKLDFLKYLACERMFMGYLNEAEADREAARLVFSGDELLEQVKRFLKSEKRNEVEPRLLATDVKGTPLLREVGTDVFAFAHLTIQEYLAATALSRRDDCERIFCRAYFNSALASMEVLPMTMGLAQRPAALYATLEGLPESLIFMNLRLRARGLSYVPYTSQAIRTILLRLGERLLELNSGSEEETIYGQIGMRSLSAINSAAIQFLYDRLETLFRSDNVEVRLKALLALYALGGERATGMMIEALKDKEANVQLTAIPLLMGREQSLEALIKILQHPNPYVWFPAARVLELFGGERVVEAMSEVLQNEDQLYDLRLVAAETLGRLGSERACKALLSVLKREDKERKVHAKNHTDGDVELPASLGHQDDTGENTGESDGDDDHLLLYKRNILRKAAAQALRRVSDEAAFDVLVETLKNREERKVVRSAAAEALGRIGNADAVSVLLETLKNRDEPKALRGTAAEALGRIGDERAVEVLLAVLKNKEDESFRVRKKAAVALKRLNPEKAIDAFVALLEIDDDDETEPSKVDTDSVVVIPSASELDMLLEQLISLDAASVETLATALHYSSSPLAPRAAKSLGRLGGEEAVEALAGALRDLRHRGAIEVTGNVVAALEQIGGERAIEALIGGVKPQLLDTERIEELGLNHMQTGADHEKPILFVDTDVRIKSVAALGRLRDKKGVDAVLEALEDSDDSDLRETAARALGQMGGEKAITGLIRLLQDDEVNVRIAAIEALGEDGAEAVEALLGALKPEVREKLTASRALARLGDDILCDGLVKALSGASDLARQKAAEVVGYYADGVDVFDELTRMAATDPADEVRKAAGELRIKYERKLKLFGVL
jgi:HEAT repeat protein/ABC-type iron transport system FetAB ATPase subunit